MHAYLTLGLYCQLKISEHLNKEERSRLVVQKALTLHPDASHSLGTIRVQQSGREGKERCRTQKTKVQLYLEIGLKCIE